MVQDRSNAVDVGSLVGLFPAAELLRRRVAFRAELQGVRTRALSEFSHRTVIHQHILAVRPHQNIGRLQIPEDHGRILPVQLLHDAAKLQAGLRGFSNRERSAFLKEFLKRFSFHIFHDIARKTALFVADALSVRRDSGMEGDISRLVCAKRFQDFGFCAQLICFLL